LMRAMRTTPMATKTEAELIEKAELEETPEVDPEEVPVTVPVTVPVVTVPVTVPVVTVPVTVPVETVPLEVPVPPVVLLPLEDPLEEPLEDPLEDPLEEPLADPLEVPLEVPVERRPVVVVLRPVVVVRLPVVEIVPVVLVAGQSERSLMVSPEQVAPTGPDAVPSRHSEESGHHTQKGSRRQFEQEVNRKQSTAIQESKNHSEQLRALPPGPTAFPGRHSRVLSHQPQESEDSSMQESQSLKRTQVVD